MKKQLETETDKRSQLEKTAAAQKAENAKLKDLNVKLERDLTKALNDIKEKEWELKQMESKRDKAIVEHKHVYEAAKRMTDAQLAEAQLELQKNAAYIRSLEKAKARLLNEAEDLARETEKERAELRAKERNFRQQEENVIRAAMEREKERIAKDAHSELRTMIETYKAKEREYQERLEAAEIARAKAARSEAFGTELSFSRFLHSMDSTVTRTLSELEKSQKDVVSERKALQERVRSAEQRMKEMYAKLGEGRPELTALNELRQRLAEELDDERAQHQKDLAERDFTIDQTRKKYQGKFSYVQVASNAYNLDSGACPTQ